MIVRIGEMEFGMSKVTFVYKCFVLGFVVFGFAFEGAAAIYTHISAHSRPTSPFQALP